MTDADRNHGKPNGSADPDPADTAEGGIGADREHDPALDTGAAAGRLRSTDSGAPRILTDGGAAEMTERPDESESEDESTADDEEATSRGRPSITKEEIDADIARYVDEHGHPPNTTGFNEDCEHALRTLYGIYDSIEGAIAGAGFNPEDRPKDPRQIDDVDLLADLARVYEENNGPASRGKYDRMGQYSTTSVDRRFDPRSDAWEAARRFLETDENPEAILDDLMVDD